QACNASLPLQSSWMSKTYLKSDHFNGGGSPTSIEVASRILADNVNSRATSYSTFGGTIGILKIDPPTSGVVKSGARILVLPALCSSAVFYLAKTSDSDQLHIIALLQGENLEYHNLSAEVSIPSPWSASSLATSIEKN